MNHIDRHRERGFTLIELMVVITIIGLLVGVAAVKVIDMVDEARVAKAQSDIVTFKTALKRYRMKKGHYPSTGDGLEAIQEYLEDDVIFEDPWGTPYDYKLLDGRKFVITSYGADKQEGGENDIDRDIRSDALSNKSSE